MRVAVVTPVAGPSVPYLSRLVASFADATAGLPEDIELMWRLQVDGVESIVADRVKEAAADSPVEWTVGWAGRQRGAAYCRTVGLLEVNSAGPVDVVVTIDADDMWLPGGLTALLAPLRAHQAVTWAASGNVWIDEADNVTDVYPPGGGLDGEMAPGLLRETWERIGQFPFAAACAAYRAEVVLARGGWPASPSGEDAVLMMGVSDRYPGYAIVDPLFAYRKHERQTTRSKEHAELRLLTGDLLRAMGSRTE